MALPTAGSGSQHFLTAPATLAPPALGSHSPTSPARLDQGPSGVFFWVAGFQLSHTIVLVSQRWRNSFSMCWQAVLGEAGCWGWD